MNILKLFRILKHHTVRDFNTTESIEAKAFNLYDGRDYANAAKTFEKIGAGKRQGLCQFLSRNKLNG